MAVFRKSMQDTIRPQKYQRSWDLQQNCPKQLESDRTIHRLWPRQKNRQRRSSTRIPHGLHSLYQKLHPKSPKFNKKTRLPQHISLESQKQQNLCSTRLFRKSKKPKLFRKRLDHPHQALSTGTISFQQILQELIPPLRHPFDLLSLQLRQLSK